MCKECGRIQQLRVFETSDGVSVHFVNHRRDLASFQFGSRRNAVELNSCECSKTSDKNIRRDERALFSSDTGGSCGWMLEKLGRD